MSLPLSLCLLVLRGFLLWFVVPLALLSWVLGWPYWRYRHIRARQLVGWADFNLIALLQRTILRPFIRVRLEWLSLRRASTLDHRVRLTDPL